MAGQIIRWSVMAGVAVLLASGGLATADEQPAGLRQTQVTLLEPGDEPRQALRYDVEPGTTERVEIQLDLQLGQESEGGVSERVFPRAMLVAEIAIDQVEDGEIRISGTYVSLETDWPALEGDPFPPAVMEAILGPLVEATFWAHLTDRGVELEVEFEPSAPMEPLAAAIVEGSRLDEPLDYLIEVLPVEPVGVGAAWEVHDRPESFAIVSERTLRREVVDREDGMVTLRGPLETQAEDQEMVAPTTPPGVRTHLLSTKSEGERKARLRLDRLMPVEARMEARVESEMRRETRTEQTLTHQISDWVMRFGAAN